MTPAPFDQSFAYSVYRGKYAQAGEEWPDTTNRVTSNVMAALYHAPNAQRMLTSISDSFDRVHALMDTRRFIPGGRYLYASGREFHQTQNCLLLRAEDTREGWADLSWKSEMALLTGAGIGVYYSALRSAGTPVRRTGGVASGPLAKAIQINDTGRAAVQGGDRRSAIWGGLSWSHPDIEAWITAKDWPEYIRKQKEIDPSIPADLDMTNISVCLDDHFFEAYRDPRNPDHERAQRVFWMSIEHMLTTGEPGFSVDLGSQANENLRNACTEIVSEDDSDICNLGGLVLSRFKTPQEFGQAVRAGVEFLTAGTLYSDVPYAKVAEIREKNRRLGLDLLGVHEFLLRRGIGYGTPEAFEVLEPFMREYDRALEYACDFQDKLGLGRSIAATSGAPTGTRAIIAETTTAWEPVPAAAYVRSVITSKAYEADERTKHYVVDPTVSRMLADGSLSASASVEDAFSLAYDYERRFEMQAYAQSHTDQALAMTINLPEAMSNATNVRSFGETLLRYLPKLRGITVYPDGARSGQPITPVPLAEALAASPSVEAVEDRCATGVCGI